MVWNIFSNVLLQILKHRIGFRWSPFRLALHLAQGASGYWPLFPHGELTPFVRLWNFSRFNDLTTPRSGHKE